MLQPPTTQQQRLAMVYLTTQAKDNLAEIRRQNKILKAGPATNSAIVEGWLLSDASEDARTVGAFLSSQVAVRKSRSAGLQAADRLVRRLEAGIVSGDIGVAEIEDALLKEHAVACDRWAGSLARAVAARIDAGCTQEDLRWSFRDAIDDYVHGLLSRVFSEIAGLDRGIKDEEAVEWIRRRLGIWSADEDPS